MPDARGDARRASLALEPLPRYGRLGQLGERGTVERRAADGENDHEGFVRHDTRR